MVVGVLILLRVDTPTIFLFVCGFVVCLVWCLGGVLRPPPIFAFRRRQTAVKVVKDTPTVRCQTY